MNLDVMNENQSKPGTFYRVKKGNMYVPHQGEREMARRVRQMEKAKAKKFPEMKFSTDNNTREELLAMSSHINKGNDIDTQQ